jgi:hypothetical protein
VFAAIRAATAAWSRMRIAGISSTQPPTKRPIPIPRSCELGFRARQPTTCRHCGGQPAFWSALAPSSLNEAASGALTTYKPCWREHSARLLRNRTSWNRFRTVDRDRDRASKCYFEAHRAARDCDGHLGHMQVLLIALSPKFPSLTNFRSGPLCSYLNAPAIPLRRRQTGAAGACHRRANPPESGMCESGQWMGRLGAGFQEGFLNFGSDDVLTLSAMA